MGNEQKREKEGHRIKWATWTEVAQLSMIT